MSSEKTPNEASASGEDDRVPPKTSVDCATGNKDTEGSASGTRTRDTAHTRARRGTHKGAHEHTDQ